MPLKILIVTNMYPHDENLSSGTFVMQQVIELRRLGHNVDVFHFHGNKSKFNYIKAFLQVFLKTWKKTYDIVHAHYGLSGMVALGRWKTPLIITLHGSDVLIGVVQPFLSRFACRLSDAVIAVSPSIASRIPGSVIPCGIDLDLFKPLNRQESRAKLLLPQNKRLVLFPFDPGRKIKRYDLAQDTIQLLASRGHNIQLLIAKGVKNENMPWYYNAADAMILCSNSEGSPTSVKEALACNLPVVSTDVGDVRQIFNGTLGTIICEQNIESLTNALEHVLNLPGKGKIDTRLSMQRFDQRSTVESIISVYQKALGKNLNV